MVRTFIGIELDQSVVEEISSEISYLKSHFPQIGWVQSGNLHITLKFLGNVIPNDLRMVFENLTHVGKSVAPFSVDLTSVRLLPDKRHPRIVYGGCGMGEDNLRVLHKQVEDITTSIGYPEEKKAYFPHITLGRVKKPSMAMGIENYIDDLRNVSFGITDVSEIIVFMSELKSDGAVYSPMHRIELEG